MKLLRGSNLPSGLKKVSSNANQAENPDTPVLVSTFIGPNPLTFDWR
jgi:hypothetical protein